MVVRCGVRDALLGLDCPNPVVILSIFAPPHTHSEMRSGEAYCCPVLSSPANGDESPRTVRRCMTLNY